MEDWLLIEALGGEAAFTTCRWSRSRNQLKKRMMVSRSSPFNNMREPLNEGERIVFSTAVYAHGASER